MPLDSVSLSLYVVGIAMDTLAPNTTLSLSRRQRYDLLGRHCNDKLIKSFSYRRRRAQQRQILFRTYKLASSMELENLEATKSPKLKKVVVKVKKIVASVLMFMRGNPFRSCKCNSKSAITAVSPSSIRKTF